MVSNRYGKAKLNYSPSSSVRRKSVAGLEYFIPFSGCGQTPGVGKFISSRKTIAIASCLPFIWEGKIELALPHNCLAECYISGDKFR